MQELSEAKLKLSGAEEALAEMQRRLKACESRVEAAESVTKDVTKSSELLTDNAFAALQIKGAAQATGLHERVHLLHTGCSAKHTELSQSKDDLTRLTHSVTRITAASETKQEECQKLSRDLATLLDEHGTLKGNLDAALTELIPLRSEHARLASEHESELLE